VQLNKVTSNTESTIKQHELVSDDESPRII
ncbi:hypothetical protein KZF78_004469, partial [Escherichia coli]|nr:hypothetical protein [Escherichia coli]